MIDKLKRLLTTGQATKRLPPILHHHIPKTAGTSFNAFLDSLYDTDQILPKRGLNKISKQPGFESVFKQNRLIHVHTNLLSEVPDDWLVVTFLRPAERRAVSLVRDWARLNDEDLQELPKNNREIKQLARHASISEVLNQDNHLVRQHLHNGMCKSLLSRMYTPHYINQLDNLKLAQAAYQVIKLKIDFVGDATDYTKSLASFCQTLGIKKPKQKTLNKTDSSRVFSRLKSMDKKAIQDSNIADFLLYEFAFEQIKAYGHNPRKWQNWS